MIKNFVQILELLGDRLEVCVSVFYFNLFAENIPVLTSLFFTK